MKRLFTLLFFFLTLSGITQELVPYRDGNKWGYSNSAMEIILPLSFEEAQPFNNYGLAIVKSKSLYGVINTSGNWVLEPKYTMIKPFSEGIAAVCSGGTYYPKEEKVYNGRWKFVDATGKPIGVNSFYGAKNFTSNVAAVQIMNETGPWQLMDKSGATISDSYPSYFTKEGIHPGLTCYKNGFVIANCVGGKFIAILNSSGKPLTDTLAYENVWWSNIATTGSLLFYRKNGKFGAIDTSGRERFPFVYDEVEAYDNSVFILRKGNYSGLISGNGETIIPVSVYGNSKYYSGKLWVHGNQQMLIGKSGGKVLDEHFIYYYAGLEFYNYADTLLKAYNDNGALTYAVDIRGKFVDFENAGEGMIPFVSKGKKGFMNAENGAIIPANYEFSKRFSNGLALVTRYKSEFYIDKSGREYFTFHSVASIFRDDKGLFGLKNQADSILLPAIYHAIYYNGGSKFQLSKYQDFDSLHKFNLVYGIANAEGRIILPVNKRGITALNLGDTVVYLVRENNNQGYDIYNDKMEFIRQTKSNVVFNSKNVLVIRTGKSEFEFLNSAGKTILKSSNCKYWVIKEQLIVSANSGTKVFNTKKNLLKEYDWPVTRVQEYPEYMLMHNKDKDLHICLFRNDSIMDTPFLLAGTMQNLLYYKSGEKWGFTNLSNKKSSGLIYDYLLPERPNWLIYTSADSMGFIASDGNYIDSLSFSKIYSLTNGIMKVKKNLKFGYIDKNLNPVIPIIYDELTAFEVGFALARKGDKWGVINFKNEVFVPFEFKAGKNERGVLFVMTNFDGTLSFICPYKKELKTEYEKYTGYYPLDTTVIIFVEKNGKTGVISSGGAVHVPVEYRYVELTSLDQFIVQHNSGKWGLLDLQGNTLMPFNYEEISEVVGYDDFNEYYWFVVKANGKYGVYDSLGKQKYKKVFDKIYLDGEIGEIANTMLHFKTDGKYGILGPNGKMVIGPVLDSRDFTYVDYFVEGIMVKSNGYYGILSYSGNSILPCKYDALNTDEEVFDVKRNRSYIAAARYGKWGVINSGDSVMVDFQYSKILANTESIDFGLLEVAKQENRGLVDFNNNEIVPCEYRTLEFNYYLDTVPVVLAWNWFGKCFDLYNLHGKKIFDNIRSGDEYLENLDGLFLIEKNKKVYIVRLNGTYLVENGFDWIEYNGEYYGEEDKVFHGSLNGKKCFISLNGTITYEE